MLTMLLEKNRMSYLPIIRDVYIDLVDDKENRARGTVWTAFPLDPALIKRIEGVLQEKFRKKKKLFYQQLRIKDSLVGLR